jgi:hypothetical protein
MKASNLEMLYNSAQNEIRTLNDRIVMLEKRLASSNEAIKNVNNREHYGGIVDSAMYQQAIIDNHAIYDENKDGPCNIIMSDVSQIDLNDINNSLTSPNRTSSSSNAIYICASNDYSTTTSNDMSIQQIPKNSDLFCDPTTTSDERIWIASTSPATSSPLYPTFVTSNPSKNTRDNGTFPPPQDTESQWIQPYFFHASNTIPTTHHHPLNLKWILSDEPNEE